MFGGVVYDVVTCGFAPAALQAHPCYQGVSVLPAPEAPDFLEAGHELVERADADRRLLLVHAAGTARSQRVAMLRALTRRTTVAPLAVDLPAAGLAASATWLAALAEDGWSAGEVLSLVPQVSHHLPTYAVTSSVAGLDLPVRLHQHVLSWLPGTRFTVVLDGSPRVANGSLADHAPAPAEGGGEAGDQPATGPEAGIVDLVVAGEERYAATLAPVLERYRVGERHVVEPGEPPAGRSASAWWGRARAFEACVVPRDLSRVRARAATVRCQTCGEAATAACPFCRSQEGVLA
jgi:hypothetical protein